MASSDAHDPGKLVRDAVSKLESRVDAISTEIFGTSQFAQAANSMTAMTTRFRKGMHDGMAKTLETYNMPSREDVTALGERLMSVETRLGRIEELLTRLAQPAPARKAGGPSRTKKPPSESAAKPAAATTRKKSPTRAKPAARKRTKSTPPKT